MPKATQITQRAAAMTLIISAILMTGCNSTASTVPSSFLMRSTSSPAAAHLPRTETRVDRTATVEAVVTTSPLLSATSSPAFRMLDLPATVAAPAAPAEPAFVNAVEEPRRHRQLLPLMMASSSPAFLHRTKRIDVQLVAQRPTMPRPSPDKSEQVGTTPATTQTDAD